MSQTLKTQIAQATGEVAENITHLSSGHNAELHKIKLQNGEEWVAKIADTAEIEAYMLRYLAVKSNLPVPKVFYNSDNLILMEYIPNDGALQGSAEINAAEVLAELHNVEVEQFGLEKDTLIGPLHQPNTQNKSWIEFFGQERLIYMAKESLNEGLIDSNLVKDIEKLVGKLSSVIDNPSKPSLIHGDMWGGNVLSYQGKISGFVDPAIYYADPEIELAFSTMFHTFGDAFFKRYDEIKGIRPGFFEIRKDLYNLYPLLVHVRVYGSSYVGQVQRILARFV